MILVIDEKWWTERYNLVAERVFSLLWEEQWDAGGNSNSLLPQPNDPWDSLNPFLKAEAWHVDRDGPNNAILHVRYSTQGQFGENFFETSMQTSCEVLDTTRTMVWSDTGMNVDIPVATVYPLGEYSIKMRVASRPNNTIAGAISKLNDRVFHGFAAETMQFLGASTQETFDRNGNLMLVTAEYKFSIRSQSHNMVWREATQLRDSDGVLQYYHYAAASDGTPNWTSDPSKDSQPILVSSASGTPSWAKPKDPTTHKFRYDTCDMAATLGIPTMDGDG